MRAHLVADDTITEFLALEAPGMLDASKALQAADKILSADTGIDDVDYRAIERAQNRAGNAETVSFVRETLRSVFGADQVAAAPARPPRF